MEAEMTIKVSGLDIAKDLPNTRQLFHVAQGRLA